MLAVPLARRVAVQRGPTRVDGDLSSPRPVRGVLLYHPNEAGGGSFAAEFLRALGRGLPAGFLISIREDALAKLYRFKGRIPNLFNNYLQIDHLASVAARAAIEKPVAHVNSIQASPEKRWTLEPQLVDAVLDQVRTGKVVLGSAGIGGVGDSGAGGDEQRIETPYLQLVMTRLWKEESAIGSHMLRRETLSRLGGADRIVRTHLDEVMKTLSASERQAASRALSRYLVTPSGRESPTRSRTLPTTQAFHQTDLRAVAEKLCHGDVRILRPVAASPDAPAAPQAGSIFHDVLAPAILDWRQRAETERLTQVAARARTAPPQMVAARPAGHGRNRNPDGGAGHELHRQSGLAVVGAARMVSRCRVRSASSCLPAQ